MLQVESLKRASPSPSRASVRSEGRGGRPRVITVNRDAATMVDARACEPCAAPPPPHFRSRTFSDGFIRNTSLELLLGVDCDACLALQHQQRRDLDLVCSCDVTHNDYVNYGRAPRDPEQRPRSLDIYQLERFKREPPRPRLAIGEHRSLDRKHTKSKGVSNYLSKQIISYDPTNTLVQKIKRKLSNLKKISGDTISKKHQNALQLADIASGSTGSLKKLSMLSLVDKSSRRVNSQSCIFSSSSQYQLKDDMKTNAPTYANFSGNLDQQCLERLRDCNAETSRRTPQKLIKMRSFDNNEDLVTRNSVGIEKTKFSTLDNRSRCRSMRRQMSYNEFPLCRERSLVWEGEECGGRGGDEPMDEDPAFLDPELMMHCTCDSDHDKRIPSIFYDTHGKKRPSPAPDVTERGACRACKPNWPPASSTSHSSSTTANSTRMSVWHRRWCCVAVLVLVAGSACVAGPLALRAPPGAPLHERLRLADRLLHDTPLVDGHNDLPWNIRKFLHNKIKDFRFDEDLRTISPWATSSWSHTDLPRLKQGRVAAQFWAAYVPCDAQHRDAVQLTFEQIDLIQRLTEQYQPQLKLCTTADDIIAAHANHRICSLVGVEGGHAIGGSLGVLRTLYQVGVRYLTLTSTCDTPWAECAQSPDKDRTAGLTPFGKVVIKEMNRLGMLVDLSHVSERTMRDALAVSRAPVLFSHSSARALCNVTRNVPDPVLRLLAANKGLVMVNFYTSFLTCKDTATVRDAIAHINHIRDVAGVDCVGLGAGYDGINYTPQGLEDVSSYPLLFAELMEEGWSMEELRKLAGLNLLRVLGAAERVAKELTASQVTPYEDALPRTPDAHNCSSQDL
ncbi:unnamed protein product [Plutella xylostella]|uniref:Dipeptidase n=1 Tax=Plutella xylostella TaxID=51655 RepID=A0A8S4DIK4_PLUXY|nr:unnamed protein product [Plutella xylostella]